jgi:hypothetical protein
MGGSIPALPTLELADSLPVIFDKPELEPEPEPEHEPEHEPEPEPS